MRAKKSLGQNFLNSKGIVGEIVRTANFKKDDIVLEVGPGKGILTEALLQKAGRVIAIEKDKRLVEYLKEKFKDAKNLEIIYDDILKFQISNFKSQNYKIVANIPYYITSYLLRKFLQSDFQPDLMVLMVQKEVADRILARDKKESMLSIGVKAYGDPKVIKKVPARYFSPQPKVDSAILLINNISKDFFSNNLNEEDFFNFVRRGFSQKRKFLKNNLKLLNTECLIKCGIGEKARAENLSLENWKCLYGFEK